MFGAEALDHVAFPVRDLPRAEKFYLEVVGLTFLTQRKNADGSPRHTYVKAGDNIIGLNLPGIQTEASPSGAPRYAIAVGSEANFHAIIERIKQANVACGEIHEHSNDSPLLRAFRFTDLDNNHIEICMNRLARLYLPQPRGLGSEQSSAHDAILLRSPRASTCG